MRASPKLVSDTEGLGIVSALMELLIKPPLLSGAADTLGNLAAVLFVVVLNEQLRRWFVDYGLTTKQGDGATPEAGLV